MGNDVFTEQMDNAINNYFNHFHRGSQDYVDEFDACLGDVVIEFPNPDHRENIDLVQPVRYAERDFYFKHIVRLGQENDQ
jgi:hypothetical protein